MSKTFKLIALIAIVSLSACSSKKEVVMDQTSQGDGYAEELTSQEIDMMNLDDESVLAADRYEPDPDANIAFMQEVVNIVFFAFDSSELTTKSIEVLEDQALWLKDHPNLRIMVEGHCDERGTREYNLALGARRAAKVRSYLVALGVEDESINTISYGKERPMVLDSNEQAWSKNRRGVTILY